MSEIQVHRAIVIGSGPAGFTAAIYLSRANIPPLLFEGSQPGGQLTITSEVENFPGFPDGIQGPELMAKLRAQAERFGTRVVTRAVERVDLSRRPFTLWDDAHEEHRAESLIVATGSSARWLGLPEEQSFHGKGLSACATCDGFFFRGQEIAVVGGGDTALEEALFLTNFAARVTVVHRRGELRASRIMQERALAHPKIAFAWHARVARLVADPNGLLAKLVLADTRDGSTRELAVTGCFVAIGHTPNTAFLGGQLATDVNGYVTTQPNGTATSVAGVFACGDVQDHVWRQAVTAAGSGCMAALECERWLAAQV
jgi:thioredoxin reductase (NADPH)